MQTTDGTHGPELTDQARRMQPKRSPLAPVVTFWRIHVRALAADPVRSGLAALGVAVGMVVLVAVTVLAAEVQRPFEAFGPALVGAASGEVTQVTPKVLGRLPESTLDEVRSVDSVRTAVPVVSALTELVSAADRVGTFVIGTTCDIEVLVGAFDCDSLTERPAADGPGVPLALTPRVAEALHVEPGDALQIPGLARESAHVGWIVEDAATLDAVNAGFVALTPDVATAQQLVGSEDFLSGVFVVSPSGRVRAALEREVGDLAEVGPPRPQMPTGLVTVTQALGTLSTAGLVIGVLIAVITVMLAVEDRRSTLGTVGALGTTQGRTVLGLLGEGLLLGLVGGLVAVPFGMLLGQYLVTLFGGTILAGTGAQPDIVWSAGFIRLSVFGGAACGVLAILPSARSIAREGPLASMSGRGGPAKFRRVPLWLGVAGFAVAAFATWLMARFGAGKVPASFGNAGIFWGVLGVILVGLALAQPLARLLAVPLERRRPAEGLLVRSDLMRFPILFAAAATTLAVGAAIAIGFDSVQSLGASSAVHRFESGMPTAVLAAPEGILQQRDAALSEAVIEDLDSASERPASDRAVRYRAQIPSLTEPRIIVGMSADTFLADALVHVRGDAAELWRRVEDGAVGLSEVAAGRLRAAAGDRVELQTPDGKETFEVAGTFSTRFPDNAAVGDWILVSPQTATDVWGAQVVQAAYDYKSAEAASAGQGELAEAAGGLHVDDAVGYEQEVDGAWARTFRPFTTTGYVIMAAAAVAVLNMLILGLIQRRRERGVLHAVGIENRTERSAMTFQAIILAVTAAALGVGAALYLTWLLSLTSRVYYGFQIDWGPIWPAIGLGIGGVAVMSLAGLCAPLVRAGRLNVIDALRDE